MEGRGEVTGPCKLEKAGAEAGQYGNTTLQNTRAAASTGTSRSRVSSGSRRTRVSEQPAMSSDVQYSPT